MKLHRNSQKRIYREAFTYFIITKTHQNYPYFKEEIFCDLFIEELKLCKKLKEFRLYGFSIIYDHFNLLIQPNNKYNISKILHYLKKNSSKNINKIMGFNASWHSTGSVPIEGELGQVRLQWERDLHIQLDKQIKIYQKRFIKKYGKNKKNSQIPTAKIIS